METTQETKPNVFFDSDGGNWVLKVDWAAMRRALSVGVDLSIIEEHVADFLRGHPKLIDAIWAVAKSTKKDLTVEEVESVVSGQVIEPATHALCEAVAMFYPEKRAASIRAAEKAVKQEIDKAIDTVLSKQSTNSQDA
ncbi:MAG: hypothetical protein AAF394_00045 [Planctomycetota bacterium]